MASDECQKERDNAIGLSLYRRCLQMSASYMMLYVKKNNVRKTEFI